MQWLCYFYLVKDVYILAIESSCDDTSAAVMRNNILLSNVVANQQIHEQYGGVVPELASRAHQQNIIPVVELALKKASIKLENIHAIAFTRGPGLLGSLLVGTSFAKSIALALSIPLIEVNHMQGHVLAHFIDTTKETLKKPSYPFLCLTVSGGHTQIVLVKAPLEMEVIGETLDDAAGEAFDKTAKMLHLPYPGGPLIDKYAQMGDAFRFKFPHSNIPELNFSFSGLKTAVLYFLQNQLKENPKFVEENMADICASVQHTILTTLMDKLIKASEKTGIKEIALAGGVSANTGLRNALLNIATSHDWQVYIPKFEYCTDNAAMIAIVGYYKYLKGEFSSQNVAPLARYYF